MGTSEVFNSRIVHKNRTHNPLPPKKPIEKIGAPKFANLDFRPPSIFVDIHYRKPYSKPAAAGSDFHGFPWIFIENS